MKNYLKTALLAVAAIVCVNSSAQTFSGSIADYDYNRISIGWDGLWMKDGYESSDAYNGFRIDYLHGFCMAGNASGSGLFVSPGVSLSCNTQSFYDGDEWQENIVALEIPVNISYLASLGEGWYVEPFVGPHFRLNAGAWSHYRGGPDDNWFKYDGYRRCQFGGQFGLNIGYGEFNFSVAYRVDTPLYKQYGYKMWTNSVAVSIGYNF